MLDVLIVGGGPVGTYLGALLAAVGVKVQVYERRAAPLQHSRAIGIHPPALRAFESIGLTSTVINAAVKIHRGLAIGETGVLGELNLSGAGNDYPFILTLPQVVTERLMREKLAELAPGALQLGAEVVALRDLGTHGEVEVVQGGERSTVQARQVVAADGLRSGLRQAAGIPFHGGPYPDQYLMGDFPDTTPFGGVAAVFIKAGGVVESFPLPGGYRRWVVHVGQQQTTPRAQTLTQLIEERTGLHVPAGECRMLSPFGVQRYQAARMVQGCLRLIGDAAHIVSPIGGQGMNLGWLDAQQLAPLLIRVSQGQEVAPQEWHAFERRRLRSSAAAIRQAELNMAAGRPAQHPLTQPAREKLLKGLLSPVSQPLLGAAFTMRWL